jgi:hypothetical protein
MNSADFATIARKAFSFLEGRSFVHSWDGGCRVRFDSPAVVVQVAYDATRSWELDLYIGLQAGISHSVERPFGISELLRVAGRPDLGKATAFLQPRPENVRNELEWLAGLLHDHGSAFLDGDRVLFEALDHQRDADGEASATQTKLTCATQAARVAWEQRKYDEVVKQLEPVAAFLPSAEQKRLEIARRRCQGETS